MELAKLIFKLMLYTADVVIWVMGFSAIYYGYTAGNIPWMIFGLLLIIYTEIHSIYNKIPDKEK